MANSLYKTVMAAVLKKKTDIPCNRATFLLVLWTLQNEKFSEDKTLVTTVHRHRPNSFL